jgi:hypothetical protein
MRLAAWFLAVWPQAFEHASQEWLAARQASCPVGVGFGCEPFESLLVAGFAARNKIKGHCLLPASIGPIV